MGGGQVLSLNGKRTYSRAALRKVSKGERQKQLPEKVAETPLKELVGQPPARSDGGTADPSGAGGGTVSPPTLGRPIRMVVNHHSPPGLSWGTQPLRAPCLEPTLCPGTDTWLVVGLRRATQPGIPTLQLGHCFYSPCFSPNKLLAGKTLCMLLMCLLLFPYSYLFSCLNQVLGNLPF